jgi:hypothetical protein
MPTYLHGRKRLNEIWLFYANIIGYIRLILIIVSLFAANAAVHRNSFGWAILAFVCNYTGGWLLDWLVSVHVQNCNIQDFTLRTGQLQENTNSVRFLVQLLTGRIHHRPLFLLMIC